MTWLELEQTFSLIRFDRLRSLYTCNIVSGLYIASGRAHRKPAEMVATSSQEDHNGSKQDTAPPWPTDTWPWLVRRGQLWEKAWGEGRERKTWDQGSSWNLAGGRKCWWARIRGTALKRQTDFRNPAELCISGTVQKPHGSNVQISRNH